VNIPGPLPEVEAEDNQLGDGIRPGVMMKKIVLVLCFFLLWLVAAAGPTMANAEGFPLASPTPRPTQRITAPEISGLNPEVVLSEGIEGDSHPSDISSPPLVQPLPGAALPLIQDLPAPASSGEESTPTRLPIPLRSQDPGEPDCGPAALGMALDYLGRDQESQAPSNQQLSDFLSSRGLSYSWGTGVEELALAAREFGFPGSYPFFDGDLDQLQGLLERGLPPVLALGTKGPGVPGHFVTLTGISADRSQISCNDPLQGEVVYETGEFLRLWELQGRAGMVAMREKENSTGADPLIPWMGLVGAVSLLGLAVNQTAGSKEKRLMDWMRAALADPARKGIGGGPAPPRDPEPAKVPIYKYITVYQGVKTYQQEVPVCETRQVQVGLRGVKVEEPVYETRRVQVGVREIKRQQPVYTTKKVQTGTRKVKKEI
jgi:hypothetical protein